MKYACWASVFQFHVTFQSWNAWTAVEEARRERGTVAPTFGNHLCTQREAETVTTGRGTRQPPWFHDRGLCGFKAIKLTNISHHEFYYQMYTGSEPRQLQYDTGLAADAVIVLRLFSKKGTGGSLYYGASWRPAPQLFRSRWLQCTRSVPKGTASLAECRKQGTRSRNFPE